MRRAFHSFILESDEKTSTEDFDFLYEHGLIGLSEYYDATKSLPGIEPSTELRLDGQDLIGFGVSDFLEQTLSNLMWSDWAGYSADEILAFLSIAFGPYSADERLERLKDSVYVLLDRVLLVPGRGVVLFIQIYSYYGPERRYDALLRYNDGYELDELQLEAGQKTRFLEALHQTFENRNRQK